MTQAIDKNDVIILGCPVSALVPLNLKQGLNRITLQQFVDAVDPHMVAMRRGDMENNPDYRHFISYLRITATDKLMGVVDKYTFAYRRGKGIGENRLLGKHSIGIGGHIDKDDRVNKATGEIDLLATLIVAAHREKTEELNGPTTDPTFVGILIDDSDEVGRVHLGIVMEAEPTDATTAYACNEPELESLGFLLPDDLAKLDFENWSKILLADQSEGDV